MKDKRTVIDLLNEWGADKPQVLNEQSLSDKDTVFVYNMPSFITFSVQYLYDIVTRPNQATEMLHNVIRETESIKKGVDKISKKMLKDLKDSFPSARLYNKEPSLHIGIKGNKLALAAAVYFDADKEVKSKEDMKNFMNIVVEMGKKNFGGFNFDINFR